MRHRSMLFYCIYAHPKPRLGGWRVGIEDKKNPRNAC